jgi:t-SNARE complex subunit (syntaxin)
MKIKVLQNTKAASCPRGITTKEYKAGETYEIFDDLANVFVSQGWGEIVGKKANNVELENKAVEKAPEDKAVKAADKNKAKKSKPKAAKKKAEAGKEDK